MGLGKTVQSIALLSLLKDQGKLDAPSLVVVPSSALKQWENEILKFSPNLVVQTYHGSLPDRQDMQSELLSATSKESSNPYGYDVLLTTYQLTGGKKDRSFLKKIEFYYLILDEAHNIKNQKSLRFQTLFRLNSKRRLLLTGTPLQNNLEELWTLLNFLMPDEFSSLRLQNYKEVFAEYIKAKTGNSRKRRKLSDQTQYIKRIKTILGPFILRRLKSHVTLELPEKKVSIEYCEMTKLQGDLYVSIYQQSKTVWAKHQQDMKSKKKKKKYSDYDDEDIVEDEDDEFIDDDLDDEGVKKPKKKNKSPSMHGYLNNILMQLRKACNHPILLRNYYTDERIENIASILHEVDPEYRKDSVDNIIPELSKQSDWELHQTCYKWNELREYRLDEEYLYSSAGKLVYLSKLLPQLYQGGHRILMFSQMTKVLDVLQPFLDHMGYRYLRMDGSTDVGTRQGLIDQYNDNPDIFIFLLSTRAAGLGINLTSADTVIFYDICFNPQVDRQAEDRCHRLGQSKTVHVIKLVTSNTCEEHILQMAYEKKELNDIVLGEGDHTRALPIEAMGDEPTAEKENIAQLLGNLFTQANFGKKKKTSSAPVSAPSNSSSSSSSSSSSYSKSKATPKRKTRRSKNDDDGFIDNGEDDYIEKPKKSKSRRSSSRYDDEDDELEPLPPRDDFDDEDDHLDFDDEEEEIPKRKRTRRTSTRKASTKKVINDYSEEDDDYHISSSSITAPLPPRSSRYSSSTSEQSHYKQEPEFYDEPPPPPPPLQEQPKPPRLPRVKIMLKRPSSSTSSTGDASGSNSGDGSSVTVSFTPENNQVSVNTNSN
eukprot:TRINITY_DN4246_c0_g2_i1.p1 TRINITY_DN4246_c0_g2~~TRINITY_DN4246_c0_g2_i1.p1  ORF type:complete len:821 (+),score=249.65 TRINITY_DN4246_c0_g2_i1:1828-4290(+)